MVLRAAFASTEIPFLVGFKDRSDWEGVNAFVNSGGEVFDYGNQSYGGLDGWQFSTASLEAASDSLDPGQYENPKIEDTEYPLPKPPFGTHIIFALEGGVRKQSTGAPDAFVAWGSTLGERPLSRAIYNDAIPDDKTVFALHTGAHGVLVSQAHWLGNTIRTTVLLVRIGLNSLPNQPADLRLGVTALHTRRPRRDPLRLPRLAERWQLVMDRAVKGYGRFCTPFQIEHASMVNLAQRLAVFKDKVGGCDSWNAALGMATTADEFRAALAHWAPKAGLGGTPYKQMRRLTETYLRQITDNTRRRDVTSWWNELRLELVPPD